MNVKYLKEVTVTLMRSSDGLVFMTNSSTVVEGQHRAKLKDALTKLSESEGSKFPFTVEVIKGVYKQAIKINMNSQLKDRIIKWNSDLSQTFVHKKELVTMAIIADRNNLMCNGNMCMIDKDRYSRRTVNNPGHPITHKNNLNIYDGSYIITDAIIDNRSQSSHVPSSYNMSDTSSLPSRHTSLSQDALEMKLNMINDEFIKFREESRKREEEAREREEKLISMMRFVVDINTSKDDLDSYLNTARNNNDREICRAALGRKKAEEGIALMREEHRQRKEREIQLLEKLDNNVELSEQELAELLPD